MGYRDYARNAYQAYAKALGAAEPWENLPAEQQEAWVAAARALVDEVRSDDSWASLGPL